MQRGSLDLTFEIRHDLVQQRDKKSALDALSLNEAVKVIHSQFRGNDEGRDHINKHFSGPSLAAMRRAYDLLDNFKSIDRSGFLPSSQPIHYDWIRKIYPDVRSAKKEAFQLLAFFRAMAEPDSLTVLFLKNADPAGVIGDLEFGELLLQLDRIAGKKVLISLSELLFDQILDIRMREKREEFAVLQPKEPGLLRRKKIDEGKLLEEVCRGIRTGRPIGAYAHPVSQPHLPFNVML